MELNTLGADGEMEDRGINLILSNMEKTLNNLTVENKKAEDERRKLESPVSDGFSPPLSPTAATNEFEPVSHRRPPRHRAKVQQQEDVKAMEKKAERKAARETMAKAQKLIESYTDYQKSRQNDHNITRKHAKQLLDRISTEEVALAATYNEITSSPRHAHSPRRGHSHGSPSHSPRHVSGSRPSSRQSSHHSSRPASLPTSRPSSRQAASSPRYHPQPANEPKEVHHNPHVQHGSRKYPSQFVPDALQEAAASAVGNASLPYAAQVKNLLQSLAAAEARNKDNTRLNYLKEKIKPSATHEKPEALKQALTRVALNQAKSAMHDYWKEEQKKNAADHKRLNDEGKYKHAYQTDLLMTVARKKRNHAQAPSQYMQGYDDPILGIEKERTLQETCKLKRIELESQSKQLEAVEKTKQLELQLKIMQAAQAARPFQRGPNPALAHLAPFELQIHSALDIQRVWRGSRDRKRAAKVRKLREIQNEFARSLWDTENEESEGRYSVEEQEDAASEALFTAVSAAVKVIVESNRIAKRRYVTEIAPIPIKSQILGGGLRVPGARGGGEPDGFVESVSAMEHRTAPHAMTAITVTEHSHAKPTVTIADVPTGPVSIFAGAYQRKKARKRGEQDAEARLKRSLQWKENQKWKAFILSLEALNTEREAARDVLIKEEHKGWDELLGIHREAWDTEQQWIEAVEELHSKIEKKKTKSVDLYQSKSKDAYEVARKDLSDVVTLFRKDATEDILDKQTTPALQTRGLDQQAKEAFAPTQKANDMLHSLIGYLKEELENAEQEAARDGFDPDTEPMNPPPITIPLNEKNRQINNSSFMLERSETEDFSTPRSHLSVSEISGKRSLITISSKGFGKGPSVAAAAQLSLASFLPSLKARYGGQEDASGNREYRYDEMPVEVLASLAVDRLHQGTQVAARVTPLPEFSAASLTRIHVLDLSGAGLNDYLMAPLLHLLTMVRTKLTCLHLDDNTLTDESGTLIVRVLTCTPTLGRLSMCRNRFTDVTGKALAAVLNRTAEAVDEDVEMQIALSNISLEFVEEEEGERDTPVDSGQCPNLKYLALEGNPISNTMATKVESLLEYLVSSRSHLSLPEPLETSQYVNAKNPFKATRTVAPISFLPRIGR